MNLVESTKLNGKKNFLGLKKIFIPLKKMPTAKFAKKSVSARKAALSQHANTKDHKLKVSAQSHSRRIVTVIKPKIPDSVRKAELELAVCICCHTSFLAVDYLGEVMKRHGAGSTIGAINLHRTKCSRLIDFVVDRQPRRFIYPKDGGRFDAPKMHVFTHLLRKCFTGKSKVRLRPPKSTIYGGSKWPLFTPKTAWIKIA